MRLRRTQRALQDIRECLLWSAKNFGHQAAKRYQRLLEVAILEIQHNPDLDGGREVPGFDGIKVYHLRHSRERAEVGGLIVRRPRHFLVYQRNADDGIFLLRILHDSMDWEQHI